MNPDTFKTDSADLAAFLSIRVGADPEIVHAAGDRLAGFAFPRSPLLLDAVAAFASGSATAPAKQLLAARRRLFHRLKEEGRRHD